MNDTTAIDRVQTETSSPADQMGRLRVLLGRWRNRSAVRLRSEQLGWKLEKKVERLLALERVAEQAVVDFMAEDLGLNERIDEMDNNAPAVVLGDVVLVFSKAEKGRYRVEDLPILPGSKLEGGDAPAV